MCSCASDWGYNCSYGICTHIPLLFTPCNTYVLRRRKDGEGLKNWRRRVNIYKVEVWIKRVSFLFSTIKRWKNIKRILVSFIKILVKTGIYTFLLIFFNFVLQNSVFLIPHDRLTFLSLLLLYMCLLYLKKSYHVFRPRYDPKSPI